MTDREKLIDLCDTNNGWVDEVPAEQFADHLIANGVTVQKWIPVTERLPDRNVQIIAFYETMRDTHAAIQIHKAWAMTETCTHWMPLPEPPKEE